jgi:hypothetical protein
LKFPTFSLLILLPKSKASGNNELDLRKPDSRTLPLQLFEKLRTAQLQLVLIRRRIDLYFQPAAGNIGNFTMLAKLCRKQLAPDLVDPTESCLLRRNPFV